MTRVSNSVLGKLARQQRDILDRVRGGGFDPKWLFQRHRQILDLHTVITDWNRKLWPSINAGQYYRTGMEIHQEFEESKLPRPFGKGREKTEIGFYERIDKATIQEWLDSLDLNPDSQYRFAHPLSVLALGEQKPETQFGRIIFTLWVDSEGRIWCLRLEGSSAGRGLPEPIRGFHIDPFNPKLKVRPPSCAAIVYKH